MHQARAGVREGLAAQRSGAAGDEGLGEGENGVPASARARPELHRGAGRLSKVFDRLLLEPGPGEKQRDERSGSAGDPRRSGDATHSAADVHRPEGGRRAHEGSGGLGEDSEAVRGRHREASLSAELPAELPVELLADLPADLFADLPAAIEAATPLMIEKRFIRFIRVKQLAIGFIDFLHEFSSD